MKATFRDRTENNRGSEGRRLNICRGWRFNDPRGYREENVANARPVVKLLSPGFMRARDTKPLTRLSGGGEGNNETQ